MSTCAPLVSIIIPCFNHARFVGETIQSALDQTHHSVEVIVVDDGSTDNSSDVIAGYPVIHHKQANQGVARAMNKGIELSSGIFDVTLGADDLLAPTYVSGLLEALCRHPGAGFAYSKVMFFGAQRREFPTEAFDLERLSERNYVGSAALFRRSAFDAIGGFDPAMPRCEDWDFWLSMAERGLYGVYFAEPLAFGRQHVRSYNSRDFLSAHGVRRELRMAARLKLKHPHLFAGPSLMRRLARLPLRLARHEVSVRYAGLLTAFYAGMLIASMARPIGSVRN